MIKLFEQYNEYNQVKTWLYKMGIKNYTINDDLSVDVDGSVYIHEKKIKEIPISFNKVTGNFKCTEINLTTLKGVPNEVGGDFNCSYNNLTSLEYSPTIVTGDFKCVANMITSLKGCPIRVNDFDCSNNKLESLDGCPQEVELGFVCVNNKLTSLIGSPREVEDFFCVNNLLTTLEGSPSVIMRELDCDNNKITSLKGCPKEIDGFVNCKNNPLPKEILLLDDDLLVKFFKYHEEYSVWSDSDVFNVARFNLLIKDIEKGILT